MKIMTQILCSLIGKLLVVYFDDILIYSLSQEERSMAYSNKKLNEA